MMTRDYSIARKKMVEQQVAVRGVSDPSVLEAMKHVPRHEFVPVQFKDRAYEDTPLPIGYEQTISQPYIVGSMTELLRPAKDKNVLEVGTGSGYQTAVLAELFSTVDTVEFVPELSIEAQEVLRKLGYTNIVFHVGDGLLLPAGDKKFNAIIVTAAPKTFPETLLKRLNPGGRLVTPVGGVSQVLQVATIDENRNASIQSLYGVRFVPLRQTDRRDVE